MPRLILFLILVSFATTAHAQRLWVPELQKLQFLVGVDIQQSDANWTTSSGLTNLIGSRELTDTILRLEAEYGIADDWAIYGKLVLLDGSLISPTGAQVLNGAGLGDSKLGLKWNLKTANPILLLDVEATLPFGASTPATSTDLVRGNGSVDLAIKLHTGHLTKTVSFVAIPGVVFRSGGYSLAAILDLYFDYKFPKGYVGVYSNLFYSIQELANLDSSVNIHDAPGSGGSYSRLSGSPVGLDMGGRLGIKVIKDFHAEAAFTKTIWGIRYPDFWRVSLNFYYIIDFFKEFQPRKIREVPFETQDNYKFEEN